MDGLQQCPEDVEYWYRSLDGTECDDEVPPTPGTAGLWRRKHEEYGFQRRGRNAKEGTSGAAQRSLTDTLVFNTDIDGSNDAPTPPHSPGTAGVRVCRKERATQSRRHLSRCEGQTAACQRSASAAWCNRAHGNGPCCTAL